MTSKNIPEHARVYGCLRDMILFGDLVPGQPVTIQGLVDQLDVGMTPVREALRRLTAEGALMAMGNRRIVVPKLGLSHLEEIYYARLAIEPKLAEIAAKKSTPRLVSDLQIIDDRVDAAIAKGDIGAYLRENHAFHFRLYRAAEAEVLQSIALSLWLRIGPSLRAVGGRRGTTNLPDKHDKAITGLVASDSSMVYSAIEEDLRQGMDHVRQDMIFQNGEEAD
ncbi:GntR family transcriptional regulator [Amylibacter marinus]|uniref:GntR family transcriptional regulator n=1 Tax=Amylibacter marinus TaxID=1475483 RepID=A0ABQ5VVZ5_9RHOB|nr:GntR family transcriptional regulator [Amylibacter marinus]GLQ35463.1 GntR family transcriptional regulator [Amylibacter marinus]